jgi:hypothetical protein
LTYAQDIFSLNFEVIKNLSLEYLYITKGSVFTGGIRKQLLFEVQGNFAQKWGCLSKQHHNSQCFFNSEKSLK